MVKIAKKLSEWIDEYGDYFSAANLVRLVIWIAIILASHKIIHWIF